MCHLHKQYDCLKTENTPDSAVKCKTICHNGNDPFLFLKSKNCGGKNLRNNSIKPTGFSERTRWSEDRIKWHQLSVSAAWSQVVVYLCRAVFMTPCDLLYCLNETHFAHSRTGIWEKLSFAVPGDDSVRTPGWGQAELLSCLRMWRAKDILCWWFSITTIHLNVFISPKAGLCYIDYYCLCTVISMLLGIIQSYIFNISVELFARKDHKGLFGLLFGYKWIIQKWSHVCEAWPF